jgi:hypothetical protein
MNFFMLLLPFYCTVSNLSSKQRISPVCLWNIDTVLPNRAYPLLYVPFLAIIVLELQV